MKKDCFVLSCLGLLLVLLSACSAEKESPQRILMVSIPPQQYLLEKIVGDRYAVKCMLAKGGNPESYEPSMAYMMNLEKSDAYFFVGNIGFEAAIKGKIKDFNPSMKTYDVSEGIALLKGSHHFDADDKEGIDPHIWSSVANVREMARNMCRAVVDLDVANKDFYEDNCRCFETELDAFQDSLSRQLAPVKGAAFVVWHPSLSYFARDYGLEQISVEYDGKEAPAKHIESRIRLAKERRARVFFLQKDMDMRQAESLNAQLGTKLVTINPLAYEWKTEMQNIADAFTE